MTHEVIQADREAAAELAVALGISAEDFTSGMADILVRHLSFYRIATERRIVEWLRTDAALTEQEAIKINANTTGNPRKIAAEWDMLVRLKRGLATAIEAGAHRND